MRRSAIAYQRRTNRHCVMAHLQQVGDRDRFTPHAHPECALDLGDRQPSSTTVRFVRLCPAVKRFTNCSWLVIVLAVEARAL
jgi:hypothetical protein